MHSDVFDFFRKTEAGVLINVLLMKKSVLNASITPFHLPAYGGFSAEFGNMEEHGIKRNHYQDEQCLN